MKTVEYFYTNQLLWLCVRAEKTGRNRQVYTDKLSKRLDDAGRHLVGFKMLHNDVEWRLQILCKVKDSMDPVIIWLDASFDDFDSAVSTARVRKPSPLEELGLAGY